MGLFDSGNKEAAEKELIGKLKNHLFLNFITNLIKDKNNEDEDNEIIWLAKRTGYYDSGERTVVIGADSFCVKMTKVEPKAKINGEMLLFTEKDPEFFFVPYTAGGNAPLHMYTASNGKTINQDKVVHIWACVVQDRLKELLPSSEFGTVFANGNGTSSFAYTLPELEMIDWLAF